MLPGLRRTRSHTGTKRTFQTAKHTPEKKSSLAIFYPINSFQGKVFSDTAELQSREQPLCSLFTTGKELLSRNLPKNEQLLTVNEVSG